MGRSKRPTIDFMETFVSEISNNPKPSDKDEARKPRTPMVFISHDTRDAEIAEAFSKLLTSVSAGVLKSFRSSDRKGNQGIEYGIEWYPAIMKKLEAASDVVCLLTPNSINRPWLLYEAGVAKGKLETPVHGLALGIPLTTASSGPFAQFQNCDDAEDSLTGLVMQLVARIPNAEPDRDIVKGQVQKFNSQVDSLQTSDSGSTDIESDESNSSDAVAKMFEEIKVMYQDLPTRVARRLDPARVSEIRRRRGLPLPQIFEEIVDFTSRDRNDPIVLLMVLSQFRDEFPWLYEIGTEAYRKIKVSDPEAPDEVRRLMRTIELVMHHPLFMETGFSSKRRRDEIEGSFMFLRHYIERWS
jgi:hypothetical protein